MLIRFMKWFRGYLLIAIRGYSPERFINLCRNRGILLWSLGRAGEHYECYISLKAFKKLRPIVRKTHTRPIIRQRFGFPFLVRRLRKRKTFLMGAVLFAVILYALSLFVWDISVEGQYGHTKEAIIKYLREIEVYPGRMKKDLDCRKMEEDLRSHYKDIGWVSAEIKGTRLRLKLVETNMPVPYEAATQPCHLIASHDGVVASIVTRKGTPMVKKGAEVKKGDILISGIVDIIGDNDVLMRKEPVIADGDITLRTRYPYQSEFPMHYQKRIYTGAECRSYGISALGRKLFSIPSLKKYKSYEKYDIIRNEKNISLTSTFILPFSLYEKKYMEYEEEEALYTAVEAKQKAVDEVKRYLKKLKEKDVLILENHVTIRSDKKKCTVSGFFAVEEKAQERKTVTDSEWRMEKTDESDGESD